MHYKTFGKKIPGFHLTRIIIGILVLVGVVLLGQMLADQILSSLGVEKGDKRLITSLITVLISLGSYWLLVRVYEKRRVTELSGKKLVRNLGIGFLLGLVLQSLTILVIFLMGGYGIVKINPIQFLLIPFAMAISTSVFEELLLRGVLFRIIEERLGSYIALGISALIFGGLHFTNPNSSILMALAIAIQAGLLLGAAFIYARNLWFPIAIHAAWNFAQSGIYGAATSGFGGGRSLITSEITGARWFTGGAFGPEGSLQATLFCLAATTVLMILSHRQNRIIPLPARKRVATKPI